MAPADAPPFPPHIVPGTELRVLPRNEAGRQYQLHVALPDSYRTAPEKKYPVVFVTDAYWDFVKIAAIHGELVYDRVVPEFITVGLGYAGEDLDYPNLRRWELSPIPLGDAGEASGRAADFLRTLETVVVPFVEREYRADPSHRVLAGSSLGGLFTLYTLLTKPELFEGYVAASPGLSFAEAWMLEYEEKYAARGRRMKARLYVTIGGNEKPRLVSSLLRWNARIAARRYDELAYEFRIIEGERHAAAQMESYVRGLRHVFLPLAPETGPEPDR